MQFQDTRLYEFGRWILAWAIGWAIAATLFGYIVNSTDNFSAQFRTQEPLREQINSIVAADGPSFTSEQRDELIALERQSYAVEQEYQASQTFKICMLGVLGIVLLISTWFMVPMMGRLIVAVIGASWCMSLLFRIVQQYGNLIFEHPLFERAADRDWLLVFVFLLSFVGSVLFWHYFCTQQRNPERYIAVQVVAALSFAALVFYGVQAIGFYLPQIQHIAEPEIDALQDLKYEKKKILKKENLSETEKERLLAIDRQIRVEELNYLVSQGIWDDAAAMAEAKKKAELLHQANMPARTYRAVLVMVAMAVCAVLGIIITKPWYISFGFIFAIMPLLLIMPHDTQISGIFIMLYAALLVLAVVYFLYRQPRQTT